MTIEGRHNDSLWQDLPQDVQPIRRDSESALSLDPTPDGVDDNTLTEAMSDELISYIAQRYKHPREHSMLSFLMHNPGRVITPADLRAGSGQGSGQIDQTRTSAFLAKLQQDPVLGTKLERTKVGGRPSLVWDPAEQAPVVRESERQPAAYTAAQPSESSRKQSRSLFDELDKYPGMAAAHLTKDVKRGAMVLSAWQLQVDADNATLLHQGETLPIDSVGVDMVLITSGVEQGATIGDLRMELESLTGEKVGFRTVIDQLRAARSVFAARGIEGWRDNTEKREDDAPRTVRFDLPESA